MGSKISKILEEIDKKREELYQEYSELRKKYNFEYIKGKIRFSDAQRIENKKKKIPYFKSLLSIRVREILSIPFIYSMIIPAFIWDVFMFIYQNTAIRLYGIPLVKRSDYIKFDRNQLDYLNWGEKVNCWYCSYVNGLLSYSIEVAGRTERYWCPIKYASKRRGGHSQEKEFADFGDADGFREVYRSYPDKK